MCGLFGFTGRAKSYSRLNKFLNILAIETSERGTDATGFAALLDSGEFIGSKAPAPASRFVFEDSSYDRAFDMRPSLMIGHCRLATHGTKENPKNNHPHVSKDRMLAIAHNGIVMNHTHIARSIGADLRGECDSEVILRMVERAIPPGEKHPYDKLVGVCQSLEDAGAMFSVIVLDKARRCVWSLRNYSNPLVYWESEHFGVTIFASELSHIERAASLFIGKKAAKKIKTWSPNPGRVFRFADDGRVTYSHREAACVEYAYRTSARWASEYYGFGALADSVDDSCAIVPSSIGANTENFEPLPHAKECECMTCAIIRTEKHSAECTCVECERIVARYRLKVGGGGDKVRQHSNLCICEECGAKEIADAVSKTGGTLPMGKE